MNEQNDILEQAVWSSDYACSLSQEQWCEELQNRFSSSINAAVESLSTQEPVRGIVDQLSMQPRFMTCWKVFPGHFDQERFTFPLRVSLLGGIKPNVSAIGNTLGAVPIMWTTMARKLTSSRWKRSCTSETRAIYPPVFVT
jgi:hypothetical protein